MPSLNGRERLRRILCATIAATTLAAVIPAVASACTPPSGGSQLLKVFGDYSYYVPAPGGTFENGATGWTLNKASVVSGNESYYVNGSGSHSLSIPAGGAAVSQPMCVSTATPWFRFFSRLSTSGMGQMSVYLLWVDSYGYKHSA